ncbi:hypothetical protein [Streptomyces sp. NPDC051554]|uniref:hypothetical protein n=1 Tax=Streptomyces sp. NPDC051554 TaxID=3365656 RepID=UPI003788F33F
MSAGRWDPDRWTPRERLAAIVAQEINDAPAEELIQATTDDELRAWAAKVRAVGQAKGWSTWAADYMNPDVEFVDVGVPLLDEIDVGEGAEKDTSGDRRTAAGGSTPDLPELLRHASSFEIPRPENKMPLVVQRIYGRDDAWVILNRVGHCWTRSSGGQWTAFHGGLGWLEGRPSVQFPLTEAWTLARRIAATDLDGKCRRNVVDGDIGDHFFKKGAPSDAPSACTYCGGLKPEEPTDPAGPPTT